MFSRSPLSKIDVLESKLSIYEQLSREMLDKLESAVEKISESNNRIALILAKHDERIEQSIKSDRLIVKMIEDMKSSTEDRLHKLEIKSEDFSRVKWTAVGIGVFATLIATIVSSFASPWLTPEEIRYRMEPRQVPIQHPSR